MTPLQLAQQKRKADTDRLTQDGYIKPCEGRGEPCKGCNPTTPAPKPKDG